MNPLGAPTAEEDTAKIIINSGELLMSEFDKKSLRLLGVLAVSGFIILLILYCWAREFCRRNLGFGFKVFSARNRSPNTKQKRKKLN